MGTSYIFKVEVDNFYTSSQLCPVYGYHNVYTKDLYIKEWIFLKCKE